MAFVRINPEDIGIAPYPGQDDVALPPDSSPTDLFSMLQSAAQNALSFAGEYYRPYVRAGTNVASVGLGLPGDILSLLTNLVARPLTESLADTTIRPYEETPVGKVFRTSPQIKEGVQSIAPDYLKPRDPIEEFTDNIIEDTALLFSTRGKGIPYVRTLSTGQKLFRSFAKATGANVVGKGLRELTGNESAEGWGKLGSLLLFSLLDKQGASQYAQSLYRNSNEALPQGARVSAENLSRTLNQRIKDVSKGTLAPSEKFVVDEANAVLGKIKDGSIAVDEAVAAKRSLNEKTINQIYATPEKEMKARARKLISGVQKALSDVIADYGKTNPDFYTQYKAAQEAFGAIAQSELFTRFAKGKLKEIPGAIGLAHILGVPVSLSIGPLASAAGVGAYAAGKVLYQIAKSPTLRKYYLRMLQAVTQENAVLFNREVERLDRALQREQSKGTFVRIDPQEISNNQISE